MKKEKIREIAITYAYAYSYDAEDLVAKAKIIEDYIVGK